MRPFRLAAHDSLTTGHFELAADGGILHVYRQDGTPLALPALFAVESLPETLLVHASPDDMGRLIGRRGRVIQALRQVTRAAGASEGVRATVDVAE